jgi:hypothetical protein
VFESLAAFFAFLPNTQGLAARLRPFPDLDEKMDRFAFTIPARLVLIAVLTMAPEVTADALQSTPSDSSQCIHCHTRVKGLIRLSWEVEKRHPRPAQSAETSGEG